MKKITMTLGLAAATVVAVNAQDATLNEDPLEAPEEVVEIESDEATISTDATDQMGEDQGVMSITEAELPEEVTKGLQDSEFAQATVEEVYVLDEAAVDKLMDNDAEQMYIGDQNPDKIYQLQVQGDEEKSILYFDEQGELLGSKSM